MNISIVVPYLSTSKAINYCKFFLEKNTINTYELIEIIDNPNIYQAFNLGVEKAINDLVILLNDDMFVSYGWDVPYAIYHQPKLVITGLLVEHGTKIPVSDRNITANFGTTPENFDYKKFEAFVKDSKSNNKEQIVYGAKGWYMPIAFNKKTYIPYSITDNRSQLPNDIELIDKILPERGFSFARVNSYVYHLQKYPESLL